MTNQNDNNQQAEVISNLQLQEGLSKRLLGLDEPSANLAVAKTYFSGAGKLLAAVKRDMEACEHLGIEYRGHTKKFLGIE